MKSASFSAMGVAASPGMVEMPAEASVEVAVSRSTVSTFSSMEAMVFSWTAGSEAMSESMSMDSSAAKISTTEIRTFFSIVSFMASPFTP